MGDPEHDEEIQEILSDLDSILSDVSVPEAGAILPDDLLAAAPAPAPAAKPAPVPPPIPAAKPTPNVGGDRVLPASVPKPAAVPPPAPAPVAKPAPVPPPIPKPAAAPPPVPKPAPAPVAAPKPAPAPAAKPTPNVGGDRVLPAPVPVAKEELKIELAPREGTMPPKSPPPAADKPAPRPPLQARPPIEISAPQAKAPAQAAPPPPPAPAPAPAPVPAVPPKATLAPATPATPIKPPPVKAVPPPVIGAKPVLGGGDGDVVDADGIPSNALKDQIRRVAFLHTEALTDARDLFISFLAQSALTVSKKPIYLRRVFCESVSASLEVDALVIRIKDAKAVAVMALVEGLPEPKITELSKACVGAGLSFRAIPTTDVQKRSTAVDIMVDLMLLPSEL